ncbi:MAG: hypothetical protein ABWY45_11440 [Mycobacterium sp.]
MELKWWPVILAGLAALVAAAAVAWSLPFSGDRRRPLAHVDRLTRLPEYIRVYRAYVLSVLATLLLLMIVFGATLVASARPTGLPESMQAFDAAHPQDTMLCLGEGVTDPSAAEYLTYFARQAESFDQQRIGLTSATLRVIPLTRDHTYASDRLQGLARLARIQADLDADEQVSDADRAELQARAAEFSRPIEYVDYAPSVEDVLALCISGFGESEGTHRRQLVYLGDSSLRQPGDNRPALYTDEAVRRLALDEDVQINVIARTDAAAATPQGTDALRAVAEATGGTFQLYNPSEAAAKEPGIDPMLQAHLDQIRDNPPTAELADGRVISSDSWDTPQPALIVAVVAVVLLSLSLVVLRR